MESVPIVTKLGLHLKNCDAVWIVSDITRAADDKTAKNILNKSLRTQLYMDGQYGRIAFICTKTDNYSVKEICRRLQLQENISHLEKKKGELEKQINQILKKSKQPHSQHKLQINDLQNKIAATQQAIALLCVKARNKFSKQEIHQKFKSGLQEMQKVLNKADKGVDSRDDDNDEDDMSIASEDRFPVASSEKYRKLHIFSVSAVEYLKLLGKLKIEGKPQVFSCLKDTVLRNVCTTVYKKKKIPIKRA
ncbi:uncharacterized protein LOC122797872 [Protopterus annectens]|uniref:uncharacterized protein LOC122797872 n=1 Tax=Protopterus annectens TaxID=7888 RepID=UPI001CFBBC6D|nr:uncharacterized protein LOC122797872 [Protopterus annectens]